MEKDYIEVSSLPVMLSAKAVADLLDITGAYSRYLFRQSDFPGAIVGKKMFVSRTDFLKWLSTKERCQERH